MQFKQILAAILATTGVVSGLPAAAPNTLVTVTRTTTVDGPSTTPTPVMPLFFEPSNPIAKRGGAWTAYPPASQWLSFEALVCSRPVLPPLPSRSSKYI